MNFTRPPDISDFWASIHRDVMSNANATTVTGPDASPMVTEGQRAFAEYVISIWLCSLIGYMGVVDNVLTLMVFVRLGFQETMNISMTFIAFWDLLKCVSSCVFRLYDPVGRLVSPAMQWTWYHITGFSFVYLFFFSGLTSTALAGYVAVERCLCVSKPFLVKLILTPRVTTVINAVASVVVFGTLAVNFSQYTVEWRFSEDFNVTIATRVRSSLFLPELVTYYNILSIAWPVLSFVVICVCTGVISFYLRKASKVRTTMSAVADTGGKSSLHQLTTRDKRVIKMLLVILTVYIVTLLPRLSRYLVKLAVPEFKFRGAYNNIFFIFTYFMYLFDVINAAANPFIFYFMSSQFRSALHGLFRPSWGRNVT